MTKRLTTEQRLTPVKLEAIRKRAEAATAGPWMIEDGSTMYGDGTFVNKHGEAIFQPIGRYDMSDAHLDYTDEDATFLIHSREDIPALLAEVERLSTAIEDALSIAEMYGEDFTLEPWASLKEAIRND